MQYFGHVDHIASIVLSQSTITKDGIDNLLKNNPMKNPEAHDSAQKEISQHYSDFVLMWAHISQQLLVPGKTVDAETTQLGSKLSWTRSKPEKLIEDIQNKQYKKMKTWPLVLRLGRELGLFPIDPKNIRPYVNALKVVKTLENAKRIYNLSFLPYGFIQLKSTIAWNSLL